ncbi:2-oxoglutarate-dependent dioxygenase AOP3-like [Impatiens glandulifera]|uniref:2-oxoglutarate-dependent dioxygenase AOP3-like n=1 Tax=Impatiens glandulifera TaxID=253017 RepID=UPI001FB06FBD|nr:2-oxoglutarate-dependent dioxygenase AOP3-like [Impatiens glandulifera]
MNWFRSPESSSWVSACEKVRNALEDYGCLTCFMALSNTVSDDLQNNILTCLMDLFGLLQNIKDKNISEKPFHGYFGRRSSSPLLESLGIENHSSLKYVRDFASLMCPQENYDPF